MLVFRRQLILLLLQHLIQRLDGMLRCLGHLGGLLVVDRLRLGLVLLHERGVAIYASFIGAVVARATTTTVTASEEFVLAPQATQHSDLALLLRVLIFKLG